MFDASCCETGLHLFEVGIFARAQVIHQHTHLDTAAHSAFHRRKDALGLLITACRKVFDVNELLGMIDVFCHACKDAVVVAEQFDSIASKGGQAAQVGVEFNERLI